MLFLAASVTGANRYRFTLKAGLPYLIEEEHLPLLLPEIDKYLPTESGEPPLGRATQVGNIPKVNTN
jgi:hypothetical protein